MTPERKAQIAMAVMGAMVERIKLETAVMKNDFVGIAIHAKRLAQHHAKVLAASIPAPDPQNTITVSVQGNESIDVSGIVAAVDRSNIKATLV